MRTPIDALLLAEARACALRFECDDCAHFAAPKASCSLGYPVVEHRPGSLALAAERGADVVFCKEFELGADTSACP